MKPQLGIQLHSVRELTIQGFSEVLRQIAQIGYQGVEMAKLNGTKPADFLKMANDLNLAICGAHISIQDESEVQRALDEQEELGNRTIVISIQRENIGSESEIQRWYEKVVRANSLMQSRGMKLGLHNHDFEFETKFNGRTAFDILVDKLESDIFLEIDTYWAQTGGVDPVTLLKRFGSRASSLHIKDGPGVRGEPNVAVGTGKMDIKSVLKASQAKWHIVEFDRCGTDIWPALEESFNFLKNTAVSANKSLQSQNS